MYKPTTAVWQPSASFVFKLSVITSAVAGIGLLTGCSSTPSSAKTTSSKQLGMLDANSLDSLEDLLSATDMRAVEGDRLLILKHGDVWKRMTVGFKMDETKWDPRIEAQRSWFITRQPYLDRLSARASRYLYHTVKEAERRGMPTELALLPVIESSYDPAATSSAAAAGMWQFIPSTGKIYGLRQNSLYDGRRDVVESTRAAYEFLGSLYNQFGSWELALAAYNAGPGRIQQAINRNKAAGLPTDYWSLRLPEETMNYVPRFLAVAQIIKTPHKYGVNLPPIANRPHFREVSIPVGAQLSQIASITGLSRAELYQLNPGHRGEVVDAQSTLKILIPADLNPSVDAKLRAMKASSSGGYWATSSSTTTNTPSYSAPSYTTPKASTVTLPPLNSSKAATSSSSTNVSTSVKSVITTSSDMMVKGKTPKGSDALASFASSAALPSAPRIPVAVTPAPNVKQISTEPKLTEEERSKILASMNPPASSVKAVTQTVTPSVVNKPSTTISPAVTPSVVTPVIAATTSVPKVMVSAPDSAPTETAVTPTNLVANATSAIDVTDELSARTDEPEATQAEKEEVVKEITALAPQGTEVVDPLDGKIKLTAIQTSQSVASGKGQEVKVGFAYPKAVAESTSAGSEEAKLNSDKSFAKTESEVVVVPPKGKRSTYLVLPGDTLAVIAMKNGVDWRNIAKWNQVDPSSTLYVGTTLYLYDAKPVAEKKTTEQKVQDKSSERDVSLKIKTKSYTVKRGEYLKLIADRYALSNQELASLTSNLKADSSLIVGQKINVPLEEVDIQIDEPKTSTLNIRTVKAETAYKTENYKVARGDTLYSIAMQSKMTLNELAELNNFSANRGLMVGQRIKVPAGSQTPMTYTVQSGDSLNAVASKYNLSTTQLASLNGLSSSAGLFVGQKLKFSGEPESVVQAIPSRNESSSDIHIVASGETLASVARKYKLQLNYLAELNDLSRNSSLRVGQRLKIEGDLVPQKNTVMQKQETTSSNKNTEAYTVKSGESLNVIAARIGVTTRELADMNGLRVTAGLQRGQRIQVPKTVVEYKVRSGDSLIRLASRYGIDSSQLAEMNDLRPNASLQIGDTIKVPNL